MVAQLSLFAPPARHRKGTSAYRQSGELRSIREWPASEQPREKLRRHGPAGLSNAELLSIILRTGTPGEDAVALAAGLLVAHGGLAGLGATTGRSWPRRMAWARPRRRPCTRRWSWAGGGCSTRARSDHGPPPGDIGSRLMMEMGDLEYECLRLVLLDTKNVVLAMPVVYQGSVNQMRDPHLRAVPRAVRHNATAMIVAHNHPSGDPTPSAEDVATTRTLVKAGTLMDILRFGSSGDRPGAAS